MSELWSLFLRAAFVENMPLTFFLGLCTFLALSKRPGTAAGLGIAVTLAMGITDIRIAGSMFAIFQTFANIGIAAGEGIGTSLSDNIGFTGVFRTFALINLIVIPLFLFMMREYRKAKERGMVVAAD